jgi:hypothetical protein
MGNLFSSFDPNSRIFTIKSDSWGLFAYSHKLFIKKIRKSLDVNDIGSRDNINGSQEIQFFDNSENFKSK